MKYREKQSSASPECYHVFLGGHDLEMQTIADMVIEHLGRDHLHDNNLHWGARASVYQSEIFTVLDSGCVPVLIELVLDCDLSSEIERGELVVIDHHNERAGHEKPTSIEQFYALLGFDFSSQAPRWHKLVAANDRSHIRGLLEMGASRNEIVEVRAADRLAQGVTAAEEAAARQAIGQRVVTGALTEIVLPHNRSSTVTDFLARELGGEGYRNLLVVMPGELGFYGDGRIIERLASIGGSWCGGDLPERGFWGKDFDTVEALEKVAEQARRLAS